jgi:hypothetical protein
LQAFAVHEARFMVQIQGHEQIGKVASKHVVSRADGKNEQLATIRRAADHGKSY